jgi:orotate phosphoribosyltransferase-like protein
VVSSDRTYEETVVYLDEHGAKVNAIAILIDKKGTDEITRVPSVSLLKAIRVN